MNWLKFIESTKTAIQYLNKEREQNAEVVSRLLDRTRNLEAEVHRLSAELKVFQDAINAINAENQPT